jgi:hypothetical protein
MEVFQNSHTVARFFLHRHVEAVMLHSNPTFSCLGKVLICFLSLGTTFDLSKLSMDKTFKMGLEAKEEKNTKLY